MKEFDDLVALMATLRSEKGCAWDRKQTVEAFKTFLLEEVYELIDAIEHKNYDILLEELGDVLFHIVFIAQICKDEGRFEIRDVIRKVYKKMYFRHPHVFLNTPADQPIEVKWEELKRQEKESYSPLAGIPSIVPALLRAYIISRRVARVGFDWETIENVYEKMYEEIDELKDAENSSDKQPIREEIGDLLFTIVNIARFHDIDPEDALRYTSDKFIRRFNYITERTDINNASVTTMNRLWEEVKDMEKKGA